MSAEETTQSTSVPSPQATEAAPQSAASAGSTTPAPESTTSPESVPAPAYNPNYKYKAYGEEKEFDEWVRPVINEKTEKSIRQLYEKAHGLDGLMPKHKKLQEEFGGVNEKYSTMNQNVEYLQTLVEEKDYGTFFDKLQIPRNEIARWMLQELKHQNLPAEEKAAIEAQRRQQQEAKQYREESGTWKQKYENLAGESRLNQLSSSINNPEVAELVKAFDARAGQPGSFQNEVLRRGAMANMSGEDPSAQELVAEVIKLYGLKPTQVAAPAASLESTIQQKKALPTIPNVKGSGNAPTKKVYKSLDEIRKLGQSLA